MSFLHPTVLAWLAVAAGPVVIHLLNRGSVKSVDWGAMMFLPPAGSAGDYRSKLRQWTLLAVRTLIAVAVVVAVARPIVSIDWPVIPMPAASGPGTVVIVLDTSPAMGYAVNGRSRFEQARAAALQLLAATPRGGRVGLLTTDGVRRPPTSDVQSLATVIADLHPSTTDADLPHSIRTAARGMTTDPGRIVVMTDRRAAPWARLEARSAGPPVLIQCVGGTETDQVVVESIRLTDPAVVRNRPTTIEVRVNNLGPNPEPALPLVIAVGIQTQTRTTVAVPAGATRTVTLPLKFPDAGSHVVSASVEGAGLAAHQRADVAASVFDTVKVAALSDTADAAVRFALMPYGPADRRNEFTIVPPAQWRSADVVVLDQANPPDFQPADVEQFVLEGGGVLLTPAVAGWHFTPDFLPAAIGPAAESPATLTAVDRADWCLRFLADRPVPPVHFVRRVPLSLVGRPAVLATADDGSPVLVRSTAGRGRVAVCAVSFSPADSDLTSTGLFLPLLQSLTVDLAQGKSIDHNLPVNSSPIIPLDPGIDDRTVTWQRLPAGPRERLAVARIDGSPQVRLSHVEPGLYRLRFNLAGRERAENFVVPSTENPPDLIPMSPARRQAVADTTPAAFVDDAAGVAFTRSGGPQELWPDLFAAAVVLLGVESSLVRRWTTRAG